MNELDLWASVMIPLAFELSDQDVDAICETITPDPPRSDDFYREQAEKAIARSR